jgi:hypothetical protein
MPIILSRTELRSSRSKFGYNNASSKDLLRGEGGGGRSPPRPSSRNAALSEESCGVSTRSGMQDTSSFTTTSGTDMSSNFSSSSVRSLEDYTSTVIMATKTTKPTPIRLLVRKARVVLQATTTRNTLDQVQPSSPVDEWGHFVDFQEEPDESWVGAFLNRHAQRRKSQQRVEAVVE